MDNNDKKLIMEITFNTVTYAVYSDGTIKVGGKYAAQEVPINELGKLIQVYNLVKDVN